MVWWFATSGASWWLWRGLAGIRASGLRRDRGLQVVVYEADCRVDQLFGINVSACGYNVLPVHIRTMLVIFTWRGFSA